MIPRISALDDYAPQKIAALEARAPKPAPPPLPITQQAQLAAAAERARVGAAHAKREAARRAGQQRDTRFLAIGILGETVAQGWQPPGTIALPVKRLKLPATEVWATVAGVELPLLELDGLKVVGIVEGGTVRRLGLLRGDGSVAPIDSLAALGRALAEGGRSEVAE